MLEYALILPVAILFIAGIVDCARLLWTYATLYHAAEAAARCGAVDQVTCGTNGQIATYAVSQAYGLTIAASAITSARVVCGVAVTAEQSFTFVIPWFAMFIPSGGVQGITLHASACYPV
ncbi:MAG: TadE/TadG family type IV pilus assembly protein [Acetobacteraceae bacterium]